MKFAALILFTTTSCTLATSCVLAQDSPAPTNSQSRQLTETGKTSLDGQTASYLIRRLPASSFPDLPDAIADLLDQRGCMVPQTYQAHRPENVIHASFESPGSSDWAVLCSAHGNVDLLVFFARSPGKPVTLASVPELERLQRHDSSGVLGFDWGIDPASPQQVREAQAGMEHHPPLLDHDALEDTVLSGKSIYHFFTRNAWTVIDMPE
ncbi:hypothetical protein P8935_07555 [Telmatobacter sp. DSM 110680]|uniref:Uncharacterized protein n=1 Tax=Telmatobacter sp. DSM 110680 TaxID=3036704 RepID=A0AAU7DP23_9BACT